jgi:hypothetical protein
MADSDISSSDSDEEFLTVSDNDGKVDREALVRKKLLESFYGKSAVAAAAPVTTSAAETDDEDEDDESPQKATKVEDLDSPSFDAASYIQRRVVGASVHDLLENEEQLALQVRTLDSTMQTLVYENYSRFIDATDAIRSIGVNVQANESGLTRLTAGIMQGIDDKSRAVELQLGSLRDQVAEKIRVKRLLTRLDTLLKLPKTLREQMDTGKYRTATKSYLAAASILSKHSEGFESLKTIETECTKILADMKIELDHKLLHWSGRLTSFDYDADTSNVPDPPKTMTEIFECVGTLLMLLLQSSEEEADKVTKTEDFQEMASSAALRLLDRTLDAHMIEVQERRYATPNLDSIGLDMKLGGVVPGILEELQVEPKGSPLIAKEFLNAMLEGATLLTMTFHGMESRNTIQLTEFVSEAFGSFLFHTKSVMLEESAQLVKDDAGGQDADEGGAGYQEVASALSILVHSVRELASGLALPEVGISVDYAAKLVDQATDLTESMVRRRVDQKFHALRLSVVEDCLIPFTTRAAAEKQSAAETDCMASILQIANSTLSDCLQLVDDTIRSILAGNLELGDSGPAPDLPDLKDAVQGSTKRFAFWLADALELIAGGESSDRNRVLDAAPDTSEEKVEEDDESESYSVNSDVRHTEDDLNDSPGQDDTLLEKLDTAIKSLASDGDNGFVQTEFVLAMAEMCRMAEGSVAENLEQSISTHLGGGKRKSRSLFPSGESSLMETAGGEGNAITRRFELARSSVLVLYACNRGAEAANIACSGLVQVAPTPESASPERPSEFTWKALEIAKHTSIEFFAVFGGSKRAGPVAELDDGRGMTSAFTSRKSGIHLDVERMFKEKVPIYPHPSETLEASRNAVVFLLFKMTFRAMTEQARLLRFSSTAYCQLSIDTEFLKHMVSHYISVHFSPNGSSACTALLNLLDDFMDIVGDRCLDSAMAEMKDDLGMQGVQHVRSFLAHTTESDLGKTFIIEED